MTNTIGTAKAKADRLTPNNMHFWLCLKKVIPTTVQEKHDAMDRLPKELTGMMVSGDMLWVIAIDEGAKDSLWARLVR
ncbi:MAG: hypothetical protein WBC90_12115 [Albidovulum sp.]